MRLRSAIAWHFGFFATVARFEGPSCSCPLCRACCTAVAALSAVLAALSVVLLLGACCSASLLPCEVVQKTAVSLCCVVPFGRNFPRW
ncbi:hypothetical protein EV2_038915 [Malus domestica]